MKTYCLVIALIVLTILSCEHAEASVNDNEENVHVDGSSSANIEPESRVCEPNSTKIKECNRCRCSGNGLIWLCTKKRCLKPIETIAPNSPSYACTPNKVFKVKCNTCLCNAGGTQASCTEKFCPDVAYINEKSLNVDAPVVSPKPTAVLPQADDNKCLAGRRWKEDCNWCFCTENAIPLCTLKGCLAKVNLPTISTIINHVQRKRQTINQYQPTSGGEVIYTPDDLKNPNFSCTPSLSFKVDCNTCWCAADGKRPRFCTRIACNPRLTVSFESTTSTLQNNSLQKIKFPKN